MPLGENDKIDIELSKDRISVLSTKSGGILKVFDEEVEIPANNQITVFLN